MIWKLDEVVKTSAGKVAASSIGTGPELILAHGWPWSSYSWHKIVPALAKHFKVHWYDMPGYGQSDKFESQRTSLDIQGKVFGEILEHWNLSQPMVVAHDFGGATTLRAHLLHHYHFSRFVLMNVVAMRPWGSEFFDHVGQNIDAFRGLPPHIHKAVVEAYIQGALVNDIGNDDIEALAFPWLSELGRMSFYKQFAQADEKYTREIESLYKGIRCPTKIIWGEADPWIPLDRGKALFNSIPHASFETLAGVGHLPQLEAPDKVTKSLIEFFLN